MSVQDTRAFLEDLLLRYDPTIDVSEGSPAQVEIIEPVLRRLGPGPMDYPDIALFVRERLRAAFPEMAITEADEAEDLLVRPIQVLLEPVLQEVHLVRQRSRLSEYQSLSDVEVDALMGNFFEYREQGGFARGQVRIYFSTPQSVTVTVVNIASAPGGLRFIPNGTQRITAEQMNLNVEGSEYYFDVMYQAERRGDEYNVEPGSIRSVSNLPGAIRVRNLRKFTGGIFRESSTDFVARVRQGRHDGSLSTVPGAMARIQTTFPEVEKMNVIGFGDPEMKRDIMEGVVNPVREDAYGVMGGLVDVEPDDDGDSTSDILVTSTGAPSSRFISRIGTPGAEPKDMHLVLTGWDGTNFFAHRPRVLEVLDDERVRIDQELPESLTGVHWTISDGMILITKAPAGILDDLTAEGPILVKSGTVHIGGRTDYYVAGPSEETSTQIDGLSDEARRASGVNAETNGTGADKNRVVLHDATDWHFIRPGVTLLLTAGQDAGAYVIVATDPSTKEVWLETDLTDDAPDIPWVVVDEISVNLMDPQEVRVVGADLLTVAGNASVSTTGGTNFALAGVQPGDTIQIGSGALMSEHTIQAPVTPVSLTISPAAPRSYPAVPYRIFRRSGRVEAPVLRIKSMELLDSNGAPVGVEVPPRDPVLALGTSFHNEGQGTVLEESVRLGLFSDVDDTSWPNLNSDTIDYEAWKASDGVWSDFKSGTITFTSAATDLDNTVAEVNAEFTLGQVPAVARRMTIGGVDVLGIVSSEYIVAFTGGTALTKLWPNLFASAPQVLSTAQIVIPTSVSSVRRDVRPGDLIEVLDGSNIGRTARLATHTLDDTPVVQLTLGALPHGRVDADSLYAVKIGPAPSLRPGIARVRIGRPSIGSARVYFTHPTSAQFDYALAQFAFGNLAYRPDPDNLYAVLPSYPDTALMGSGKFSHNGTTGTLEDQDNNLSMLGVKHGDIIEILYRDIRSSSAVSLPISSGVVLDLVLGLSPTTQTVSVDISDLATVDEVVDAINAAVGFSLASNDSDHVVIGADSPVSIPASSSAALAALNFDPGGETNVHPMAGEYVLVSIHPSSSQYTLLGVGSAYAGDVDTHCRYRVLRHTQRVSSTEMLTKQDATGLYYADVELISTRPGNDHNLTDGAIFEVSGYKSDGYRLRPDNEALTYSPYETLYAEISPTLLAPGSPDTAQATIRLVGQSIQVTYDRSQLVQDVHSYVVSRNNRHTGQCALARHLFPHYVSLNWHYVGTASEAEVQRALREAIQSAAVDEELEVIDLLQRVGNRRASSVFVRDGAAPGGRRSPIVLVVYHDDARRVRARIVSDYIRTSRLQRFIPDQIRVTRTAARA